MELFDKLKDLKTLLVDDDDLIRDSLGLAFTNHGCMLVSCETAEKGLQALQEENFDIIISDLKLPGMDGLEFFKLVKDSHPKSIRLLITAYGSKDTVAEASRQGIHDIVEKPYSLQQLIKALASLIERRESSEAI
jgi:DNA-binding NtrC family response regulator